MSARWVATVAVAAIILAGCGSGGGDDVGEETPGSQPTEATTTTDAPTTTTEADAVLNLGDTYTTPSGSDLTVYDYRPNTPNAEPPPADVLPAGVVWASADVEACNGPDLTGPIGFDSWRLRTGNSLITRSSSTYGNAVLPQIDTELELSPGECLRGWVQFDVPTDATIDSVVFANVAEGPRPEWTVPAP